MLTLLLVTALANCFVASAEHGARCARGWTAVDDRCFLLVERPMPEQLARVYCRALDSELASVNSRSHADALQGMLDAR